MTITTGQLYCIPHSLMTCFLYSIYSCSTICTFVSCCLATKISKAYLKAEIVEEVIGWLGLVGTTTANKLLQDPAWECIHPCSSCNPIRVLQHICVHVHVATCICTGYMCVSASANHNLFTVCLMCEHQSKYMYMYMYVQMYMYMCISSVGLQQTDLHMYM